MGDGSLMRAIGQFFGHLAQAVKHDPTRDPATQSVRRETTEETRQTPSGEVTLRRTVIEEVEIRPPAPPQPPPPRP